MEAVLANTMANATIETSDGQYHDAEALGRELTEALGIHGTAGLHAVVFRGGAPFRSLPFQIPAALKNACTNRRNQFLAGRYCAWHALVKAGCEAPTPPPIGHDRLPHWPAGWLGSISHSGTTAIAAVTRDSTASALGIDVQRIITSSTFDEIHPLIAKPDELALLASMPMPLPQALTLIFSAKESLYKGLYPRTRRFFEFSAAALVYCSERSMRLSLTQDWGPGWQRGERVDIPYYIAGNFVYTIFRPAPVQDSQPVPLSR